MCVAGHRLSLYQFAHRFDVHVDVCPQAVFGERIGVWLAASAMAGDAGPPCVPRCAPVPDRDHIRLDQCLFTRTWWASSVLIGVRIALPNADDWWIEYDNEGMAGLLSDKSDILLATSPSTAVMAPFWWDMSTRRAGRQ